MTISEIVEMLEESKERIFSLTNIPGEKKNGIIDKLNDIMDDLESLSESYGEGDEDPDDPDAEFDDENNGSDENW